MLIFKKSDNISKETGDKMAKKIICSLLLIPILVAGLIFYLRTKLITEHQEPPKVNPLHEIIEKNKNQSISIESGQTEIAPTPSESEQSQNPEKPDTSKTVKPTTSSKNTGKTASTKDVEQTDPVTITDPVSIEVKTDPFLVIVSNYEHQFSQMENKYQALLDELIAEAKEEYRQKGEKSLMELAGKYMKKASSLEDQCDAEVNQLLAKMKQELEANHLDTKIIEEIKTYYIQYKKNLRSDMMMKAAGLYKKEENN